MKIILIIFFITSLVGCSLSSSLSNEKDRNNSSPKITLTSPLGGLFNQSTTIFAGTVQDKFAIQSVKIKIGSGSYSNCIGTTNWSFSYNGNLFANGPTNIITVQATDVKSRTGTLIVGFTISQTNIVPLTNIYYSYLTNDINLTNIFNITNYAITTNTETVDNTTYEIINTTNSMGEFCLYSGSYHLTNNNTLFITNYVITNSYAVNLWRAITNKIISNYLITNLFRDLIGSFTNTEVVYTSYTNDFYYTNYYFITNLTDVDTLFNYSTSEDTATITGIHSDWYNSSPGQKSIIIPLMINNYYVTSIGNSAFINLTTLTNVFFTNNITSINDNAFYGCTGLTNITIPDSVSNIGNSLFQNCTGLTNITIYNSITNIGDYAFYSCGGLESIVIPNSVSNIGYAAFSRSGLTSVILPNSIKNTGNNTFYSCLSLTNVVLPASLKIIGDLVFFSTTKIPNITIPSGVTNIGYNAFAGCSSLTTVYVNAVNPPVLHDEYVFRVPAYPAPCLVTAFKVPASSVAAYKAASGWSSYASLIVSQ